MYGLCSIYINMDNYTFNKNSGKWSDLECKRFEQAFYMFNNDWKKITRFVGTRTIVQVRSHAQKAIPILESKRKSKSSKRNLEQSSPDAPQTGESAYNKWLFHTVSASYLLFLCQLQRSAQNTRNNDSTSDRTDQSNNNELN